MSGFTGIERIDSRVTVEQRIDGMTACHIWNGATNSHGYGHMRYQGQQTGIHRIVYTLCVGPIPDGLVIDHLCRVRNCCNPDHLEPVTGVENTKRGEGLPVRYGRRDRCHAGHLFTDESSYWNGRQRACRPCGRERNRRQREAAREARGPKVSTRGQNVTHGKGGTYRSYGCRCAPCTRANTEDSRRYYAKRRARVLLAEFGVIEEGAA